MQCVFTRSVEQIASFRSDTRVDQQILDQSLHAAGPIYRECNEVISIGVQLPLVAPRKKLCV